MARLDNNPVLTRFGVLAAEIQSEIGTTATVDAQDAIQVISPEYTPDVNSLTREVTRNTISPDGIHNGRITGRMTFGVELKGNGVQNSGTAPRIGKLLRACGFSQLQGSSAATRLIGPFWNKESDSILGAAGRGTWAVSGTPVNTELAVFKIEATTGGASATAKLRVTGGTLGTDTFIGQEDVIRAFVSRTDGTTPTTTVTIDLTDEFNPTVTFGGTWLSGDRVNFSFLGRDFVVTAGGEGDTTLATMATAFAADVTALTGGMATGEVDGSVNTQVNISMDYTSGAITCLQLADDATKTVTVLGQSYSYTNTSGSIESAGTVAIGLNAVLDAVQGFSSAVVTDEVTVTYQCGVGAGQNAWTSGTTEINLGNTGVYLTYTNANVVLSAGDYWYVAVAPAGFIYTPVSPTVNRVHDAATIDLYYGGIKHRIYDARGTFTISAEGGGYGTLQFTFSGRYVEPTDATELIPSFESGAKPPKIERASFAYGFNSRLKIQSMSMDMANQVEMRADVNEDDAYVEFNIVNRNPTGGFDPELMRISQFNPWNMLDGSDYNPVKIRAGTVAGNTVWFFAPAAQISGLAYQDRSSIRTYGKSLAFASMVKGDVGTSQDEFDGDDEVIFIFS